MPRRIGHRMTTTRREETRDALWWKRDRERADFVEQAAEAREIAGESRPAGLAPGRSRSVPE